MRKASQYTIASDGSGAAMRGPAVYLPVLVCYWSYCVGRPSRNEWILVLRSCHCKGYVLPRGHAPGCGPAVYLPVLVCYWSYCVGRSWRNEWNLVLHSCHCKGYVLRRGHARAVYLPVLVCYWSYCVGRPWRNEWILVLHSCHCKGYVLRRGRAPGCVPTCLGLLLELLCRETLEEWMDPGPPFMPL